MFKKEATKASIDRFHGLKIQKQIIDGNSEKFNFMVRGLQERRLDLTVY